MLIIGNGDVVCLSVESTAAQAGNEGRIRAYNNGAGNITGATVQVIIPAGLIYDSHVASAGTSYDSGTGIWTLPDPFPFGSPANDEFLDICLQVTDDSLSPYVVSYTLTHDDDPDATADNTATKTFDWLACSELANCFSAACITQKTPIKAVSDLTYNIVAGVDATIEADGSLNNVTINLPLAASAYVATSETEGCGDIYTIKAINIDNTVTLSAQVGEVIVNLTDPPVQTIVYAVFGESFTVQSDGTQWIVI